MYQKDYILRLIEEFFRFLSIILKLRNEKKFDEALVKCDETAIALTGLALNDLEQYPGDAFSEYIDTLLFEKEKIEILARLLYEKTEIYIEKGSILSAKNTLIKSLLLFENVKATSKDYSVEREMKIQRLKELLVSIPG